jgi:hypothetical protein
MDAMRPLLVVVGAFILVLGFTFMNLGPTITTASFYKSEASLFSNQANGSANATAALAQMYKDEVNAANLAELIVLVGAFLAPSGGAILALGLVTRGRNQDGAPSEPPATPAT